MVPGVGGGELIVIAIVALIVVGPKDLPKLLRQLGRFVAKMRGMADDFRASFDDMARQSELDDLRKEVEALRSGKSVSPVIEDLTQEMNAISNDVTNSLTPMGPGYGKGDYHSPDSFGGHETAPEMEVQSIAAPVTETAPVKPKRTRTKAVKAVETPVETSPEVSAEGAPKPKTARKPRTAKPKATVTMGDL
jgi:sec-independent protein translocase protein TatB